MPRKFISLKTVYILAVLSLFFLYLTVPSCIIHIGWNIGKDKSQWRESVHIATVICGDRLGEGKVMLKSAVLFSSTHIVFHIFTEDVLRPNITEEINSWPDRERRRLDINFYKIQFPSSPALNKTGNWREMDKQCASQRLFFPNILSKVDSLIYLDTDTIFLAAVEELWAQFSKLNSSQMIGMVPDLLYWKPQKTCTPSGLNSGVMLMNLTRIRSSAWNESIQEYFIKYRDQLKYGDQSLINIYCYFFPSQFYFMSCSWNYNAWFCRANSKCKEKKVYVLHGITGLFHRTSVVASVYSAFNEELLPIVDFSMENLSVLAFHCPSSVFNETRQDSQTADFRPFQFKLEASADDNFETGTNEFCLSDKYNLTRDTARDLYDTITFNVKHVSKGDCRNRPDLFTHYLEKNILKNELKNSTNKMKNATTERALTTTRKTTKRSLTETKRTTERANMTSKSTTERANMTTKRPTERANMTTKRTTERANMTTKRPTERANMTTKRTTERPRDH